MRALVLAMVCALAPATLPAQDIAIPGQPERVLTGEGAMLRGLDKVAGNSRDIRLMNGESDMIGHLQVTMSECRYPDDNPNRRSLCVDRGAGYPRGCPAICRVDDRL